MAKKQDEYDYVLSWIKESRDARTKQNALVSRTIAAYQGTPSKNRYANTISQYATAVKEHDPDRSKQIMESCKDIPEKGSMVLHNAVETIVSMAQGGVGQYEFGPYDPDLRKDNTVTDRLSSAAKHWYIEQKMDSITPRWIRSSVLSGEGYIHLNRKNKKTLATIIDSSQMLTDPKRFKTNYERFIGHEQRESLRDIKSQIIKERDGYKLKTINEAEVYVSQIRDAINSVLTGAPVGDALNDSLKTDLDIFYKDIVEDGIQKHKDNPEYSYGGDEVSVAYIYDLMNDMEFKVVNRKYIIEAKEKRLSRNIKCKYTDSKGKEKEKTKKVELDHPYVSLPFEDTYWTRYPVTPAFYVLDDFDDICAMESVLYHNLSIMAPITFVGQSSDVEKVSRVSSVAGEVVEGLPQTFATLAKTHDITPVVTAIQRYEEKIKRVMNAVDPFELQAMIGDRATAKEVVATSGSVSQGLNPFLANIETAFATLGEKFFKMQLIYDREDVYSFTHNGEYAELTADEIAGDYEVRAKLKTSIKLEQEANARRALELIQILGANEAIDKQQFLGTMIPISLVGLINNEQAKNMVMPDYQPMPEEVIAGIRKRAEEEARKDEIAGLDFSDMSQEDLIAATAEASNVAAGGMFGAPPMDAGMIGGAPMPPVDQIPPEMPLDPNVAPIGLPESSGMIANDPTGLGLTL